MRVLGVVPARGGSKGVSRKNIRLLGGRPVLQWTADAALASRRLAHVMLTTDDPEIAEVGRACGLDVPFLRPASLAGDDAPMLPVVQHAVHWAETAGERVDAVCLLQPTAPFRRVEDVDGCIELLERSGADAVVTVLPVPPEHNPHWVYFEAADGALRLSTGETEPITGRQALPAAWHREGSVYVTRRDALMERSTLYGDRVIGYQVDPDRSVNIDEPADWERAESMVAAIVASGVR